MSDQEARAQLVEEVESLRQQVMRWEARDAEREQAERQLRESAERNAAILEVSHDAIISVDESQRIAFFNEGAQRIFGYSPDEVIGKPLAVLLPSRLRNVHRQHIERFAASPVSVRRMSERNAVMFGLRKDGTEFPAEGSISKIESNGRTIFTVILRDITERREMEEAVRRLAQAVAASNDGVLVVDMDGKISFANAAIEGMFGYEPGEMIGLPVADLNPISTRDRDAREILERTMAGGWVGEKIGQRKSGQEFPVRLSTSLLRDEKGQPVGMLSISNDITARKQAEEELKRREEQLSSTFQAASDAILVIDPADGRIIQVNRKAVTLLGYTEDELLGMSIGAIHSHELDRLDGFVQTIMTTGNAITDDLSCMTHDGRLVPVEISGAAFPLGQRSMIVVMIRDVTERKKAEEAEHLRTEELEVLFNIANILIQPGNLEDKASEILEALCDVVQADGAVLRAPDENQQQLRLVANTVVSDSVQEEIAFTPYGVGLSGLAFDEGQAIVANDYPSHPQARPATIASGVRSLIAIPLKVDGRSVGTLALSAKELNHFTPQRMRLLTTVANGLGPLLENARLYEEITIQEELARRQSNFMSVAAHEIRTPMTSVMGFSELLLERDPPEATRRDWLQRINRESRRLSGIVDELLDVSRIQSGQVVLTLEPLRLDSVAEEVMSAFRPTTDKHECILEIPPDTPQVLADHDKLTQILVNLMSNAVKYSPQGGRITISARHEPDRERVVVQVADQGIGIAPEDLDRLFTTFHRIHSAETAGIGGSGLGLYIVKSLAEMMGGTVWLDSELGKGSTFSFTLPIWTPESAAADLPSSSA